MTDIPSDYQRKIAVLIAQEFHDFPEPMTHRIEPILAAEGVVDPAKLASGAYTTSLQNTILQLEQQLADLCEKDKARDETYTLLSKACDNYKAKWLGSEECLETWKSAAEKWEAEVTKLDSVLAALRAEIERLAHDVYLLDKVRSERDKSEADVERLKAKLL